MIDAMQAPSPRVPHGILERLSRRGRQAPAARWIAACVALATWVAVAPQALLAQDNTRSFTINGKTLRLPIPPDACELDANVPRDRMLLAGLEALAEAGKSLKGSLRRFANCSDLADWRAARRQQVPDLIEIAEPAQAASAVERAAWLAALRGDRRSETAESVAAAWSNTQPEYPGAAGSAQRTAAVLLEPDRDDRALYEALRARTSINNRSVDLAGVTAWTMVAGQPVGLQIWTAWDGSGAIVGWLSEEQRDLVDRVLGANGEERRRFARAARVPRRERVEREERPRRDLMSRYATEISVGLIGAGLLLIAAGVIGSRILRRRTT